MKIDLIYVFVFSSSKLFRIFFLISITLLKIIQNSQVESRAVLNPQEIVTMMGTGILMIDADCWCTRTLGLLIHKN